MSPIHLRRTIEDRDNASKAFLFMSGLVLFTVVAVHFPVAVLCAGAVVLLVGTTWAVRWQLIERPKAVAHLEAMEQGVIRQ